MPFSAKQDKEPPSHSRTLQDGQLAHWLFQSKINPIPIPILEERGFSHFRSDKAKNQKFECANINTIHKSKNALKRWRIALAASNIIPSRQICHTHIGFSHFRSDQAKNQKFQCANINLIRKSKNASKIWIIALAASNIIPSRQICHTRIGFSYFRSNKAKNQKFQCANINLIKNRKTPQKYKELHSRHPILSQAGESATHASVSAISDPIKLKIRNSKAQT